MIDLQQFVSETLSQIVAGVKEAQETISSEAQINPPILSGLGELKKRVILAPGPIPLDFVEFDVAVTAEEGTGTKGGIGVLAIGLGIGAQGESSESSSSLSRIKFRIPVAYPIRKVDSNI